MPGWEPAAPRSSRQSAPGTAAEPAALPWWLRVAQPRGSVGRRRCRGSLCESCSKQDNKTCPWQPGLLQCFSGTGRLLCYRAWVIQSFPKWNRDERQACQTPSSAAFHLLPRMLKMCGASPLLGVANASRSLCCINGIIFLRLRSTPGSDCDEIQALSCQSEALDVCFQKAGLQPHGRGRKINRRTFFKARKPLPAPSGPLPCKKPFLGAPKRWDPPGFAYEVVVSPQPAEAVLGRAPREPTQGYGSKPPTPHPKGTRRPLSLELGALRESPVLPSPPPPLPSVPPPRAGAGGRGSLLLSASQHEPSSPLSAPQGDDSICNCSDLLGEKLC